MTTLYLDATSLSGWSNCREFWRRREIEKIELIKALVADHLDIGRILEVATPCPA